MLSIGFASTFWAVAWLDDVLDLHAFARAQECLRRRHAALSAQVVQRDGRFVLLARALPTSDQQILRSHPLDDYAKLPLLSPQQGTFVVHVYPWEGGHAVAVGIDHSIADARLSYAYFYELFSLYTQLVVGEDVANLEVAPLPQPAEIALAKRGVFAEPLVPNTRFGTTSWGGKQPKDIAEGTPDNDLRWRHRFTLEESAALRHSAKRHGTTVYGLVSGAVLVTERTLIVGRPDEPVNMGVTTIVDFRGNLEPPAQVWEISDGTTTAFGQIYVRADDAPEKVGGEVLRQIHEDLTSGRIRQNALHPENVILAGVHGPSIMLTNPGVLPVPPLPAGVQFQDFQGHLATPALLQTPGPDGQFMPHASSYQSYSFNGHLTIEGRHPAGSLTFEQAATLRQGITDRLAQLAGHRSIN